MLKIFFIMVFNFFVFVYLFSLIFCCLFFVMDPLSYLTKYKGKIVTIHTSDLDIYRGILSNFDMYANAVLSDAELHVNECSDIEKFEKCIIDGKAITYFEL